MVGHLPLERLLGERLRVPVGELRAGRQVPRGVERPGGGQRRARDRRPEPELPEGRLGVGQPLEGVEARPAAGRGAGEALDGGAAGVRPHVLEVLALVVGLLEREREIQCVRIVNSVGMVRRLRGFF